VGKSKRSERVTLWRIEAHERTLRELDTGEPLLSIQQRVIAESEAAKQMARRCAVPELVHLKPGERWA
jgi:hypothetical protein